MMRITGSVVFSLALLAFYIVVVFLGEHKTMAYGSSTTLHEWLGLLTGAVMVLHLVLYWKQTVKTLLGFFQSKQKLFTFLNILILVTVALTVISGIIISEQLGFGQKHSEWSHLHHVIPKLALPLILLHAVLRWKKIRTVLFGTKSLVKQ